MKVRIIFICFLSAVILCSCQMPDSDSSKKYAGGKKASSPKEEETYPEHVEMFYSRLNELSEEYDFCFSINGKIQVDDISYDINFHDINNTKALNYFRFYNTEELLKNKSGYFHFNTTALGGSGHSIPFVKDIITATLMVIEPELSYDEALAIMQEIASTYSQESDSIIYTASEYSIYLTYDVLWNVPQLKIQHHNNINNPNINIDEYPLYSYDEMKAELNYQEKGQLTGRIVSMEKAESGIGYNLYVIDEYNYTYKILYDKQSFLFTEFAPGQLYTFYGTLLNGVGNNMPGLYLQYCELIAE